MYIYIYHIGYIPTSDLSNLKDTKTLLLYNMSSVKISSLKTKNFQLTSHQIWGHEAQSLHENNNMYALGPLNNKSDH